MHGDIVRKAKKHMVMNHPRDNYADCFASDDIRNIFFLSFFLNM